MNLMITSSSVFATKAILVVDAKLKSAPSFKSAELTSLSKGETVEIKQRNRGWYQVVRDNLQQGWITLLQVRFKAPEQSSSSSTLKRVVSLRKGHSQVNATTGVRGIGEADITKATANLAALEQVKKYRAGQYEAKQFAQKVPLKNVLINYEEKSND